ncbi:Arabinanase/levansucrase/invertase [Forsythia ovata]|uniref:Arabinanase/levansucrase/invertase n=1 Tax=Forsythia ovata TaxID=205694 RepID=A0ABD1P4W6_9LAMI
MARLIFGRRCTFRQVVCGLVCSLIIFQIYSFIVRIYVEIGKIKRNSLPGFHPLLHELVEPEGLTLLPPFGFRDPDKVNLFDEFLNQSSLLRNIFFPDHAAFVDPIDPRKDLDNGSLYYYPGRIWLDTDGHRIEAHGGGILYDERSRTYYWYGEYKNGPTYRAGGTDTARVDIIGVGCYSSKDLWTWKNEGIVLVGEEKNTTHDLYKLNVLERPKVIYNDKTGIYVMWMHIDDATYTKASVGIAVSKSPTGPFEYRYSLRPHGFDSRDMTIFKDDDGVAYLIYSSLRNKELHIGPLNEDYLHVTNVMAKALVGQHREAPALFKHQGVFYMITSGCSGWAPNEALVHGAKSMLGPWETIRNPCMGANAVFRIATFFAQGTFVLPMPGGIPGSFIFMADRWNPSNLRDSRYVWLPLTVRATEEWYNGFPLKSRVSIFWHAKWRLPLSPKEDL